MPLLFTPYASNYFLAAIITVMTAWINWRQRKDYPGVYSLAVALIWLALWSLINGVDMMLVQPDQKMAVYFLENLFISLFLVYMLLFVFQYYRLEYYLNLFWRLAIGAWVASGTLLYLINSMWHLQWIRYTPGPPDSNLFYFDRNILFGFSDIILFILVLVIDAILIYQTRFGQRRDIIRASLLVTGLTLPLVLYFVYLFWVDVTIGNVLLAMGTCLTDIFISIAVFEDLRNRIEDSTAELHTAIETLHGEIEERQKLEDNLRSAQDRLALRLAEQGRQLTALYNLTLVGSQTPTSEDALEALLNKIGEMMTADIACFYLANSEKLRLEKTTEVRPEIVTLLDNLPADWMILSPEIFIITCLDESTSNSLPVAFQKSGYKACLCKWIYVRERATGLLCLFWQVPRSFSEDDMLLFAALADQAGLIMEESRLWRDSLTDAVLEERRRLARDLHDSVTQSLHSLVIAAETAQKLHTRSRLEKMDGVLAHLVQSARQALKELRLLLYEMRLASPDNADLVEVVNTRLIAVEKRAGILGNLVVEKGIIWPAEWNRELYPLVMEALNNSLKHAHAAQVTVFISRINACFELEVTDNGVGYDPSASKGGMGLSSMAERAEKLGGRLEIDSSVGQGTRVHLVIPATIPLDTSGALLLEGEKR